MGTTGAESEAPKVTRIWTRRDTERLVISDQDGRGRKGPEFSHEPTKGRRGANQIWRYWHTQSGHRSRRDLRLNSPRCQIISEFRRRVDVLLRILSSFLLTGSYSPFLRQKEKRRGPFSKHGATGVIRWFHLGGYIPAEFKSSNA